MLRKQKADGGRKTTLGMKNKKFQKRFSQNKKVSVSLAAAMREDIIGD